MMTKRAHRAFDARCIAGCHPEIREVQKLPFDAGRHRLCISRHELLDLVSEANPTNRLNRSRLIRAEVTKNTDLIEDVIRPIVGGENPHLLSDNRSSIRGGPEAIQGRRPTHSAGRSE